MRVLSLVLLAVVSSGCTCGGCASKPAPVVSAPPVQAALAIAAPKDVPAPPPLDGGELPYEVKEGSPSDEQILAAYTKDCRAEIQVTFEDMDGPKTTVDCEALAFDQNCAPDNFGCFEKVESCRQGCASPCTSCQASCGDSCETCTSKCQGDAACRRACAERRAACRTTCLYGLQRCREVTCNAQYEQCSQDAERRTKELCPDCEAIQRCFEQPETAGDRERCLPPGNAKECLEWCYVQ